MISKVMIIVVINKTERPAIKKNSPMFSYLVENFSFLLLIARKDKRLLVINDIVAIAVNSSINEVC